MITENEAGDGIPLFCKKRTALYVSFSTRKPGRCIRSWYRISARISAVTLLNRGYDTIIVDYGTPFGITALYELLSMRRRHDYNFTLVAVKIVGEGNYFTDRKKEIKELAACDKTLGLIGKSDFLSTCVSHSSAMVNGNQILYHNSRISHRLIKYLKKLR